uniref:Uncharacterized protein n=1 Tax=Arundo donax TaxID=35708 RepID=A0A0A9BQP2_ARUDO
MVVQIGTIDQYMQSKTSWGSVPAFSTCLHCHFGGLHHFPFLPPRTSVPVMIFGPMHCSCIPSAWRAMCVYMPIQNTKLVILLCSISNYFHYAFEHVWLLRCSISRSVQLR